MFSFRNISCQNINKAHKESLAYFTVSKQALKSVIDFIWFNLFNIILMFFYLSVSQQINSVRKFCNIKQLTICHILSVVPGIHYLIFKLRWFNHFVINWQVLWLFWFFFVVLSRNIFNKKNQCFRFLRKNR